MMKRRTIKITAAAAIAACLGGLPNYANAQVIAHRVELPKATPVEQTVELPEYQVKMPKTVERDKAVAPKYRVYVDVELRDEAGKTVSTDQVLARGDYALKVEIETAVDLQNLRFGIDWKDGQFLWRVTATSGESEKRAERAVVRLDGIVELNTSASDWMEIGDYLMVEAGGRSREATAGECLKENGVALSGNGASKDGRLKAGETVTITVPQLHVGTDFPAANLGI